MVYFQIAEALWAWRLNWLGYGSRAMKSLSQHHTVCPVYCANVIQNTNAALDEAFFCAKSPLDNPPKTNVSNQYCAVMQTGAGACMQWDYSRKDWRKQEVKIY